MEIKNNTARLTTEIIVIYKVLVFISCQTRINIVGHKFLLLVRMGSIKLQQSTILSYDEILVKFYSAGAVWSVKNSLVSG